jgi:hypothetical protein
MKINYKMLVAMLQEELACVQADLNTTMADLETEERIQNRLQAEAIRLAENNRELIHEGIEQKKAAYALNADFFDLGDLLMEAIEENKKSQPEQKLEEVVTGLDEFLQKQYQSRIEYLEELIFELGDDLDDLASEIQDTDTIFIDLNDEIEDLRADWAKEASEWALIDKAQLNELAELRRTICDLKDEIEMKTRVNQEGIYADKKCKFDLEQKILVLEKENKNLKVALAKSKEEAFEEDREQIAKEIEKAEKQTPKKQSSTTGENMPKSMAKSTGKGLMIDIKNKLCNKGYEVQDTGKSLLAKKPGNRHIEVKQAELPGSFKYIICGQTCYEFDQAIKASTYGAKAIAPKLDAEAIS